MKQKASQDTEQNRYQRAYEEWEARIGSAKTQMRNWRLACLLSLVLGVLLLVAIIMVLTAQKNYVYVAEVKPGHNIVNVRSMEKSYVPTQAQEEYFVARFIRNIMSVSLDPVVLRRNWLNAYSFIAGKAKAQLNDYARENNPFAQVGQVTKTVHIKNYHPIGNHSYEFTWTQTTYSQNGKAQQVGLYDGIFTVVQGEKPKTARQMLMNPLGLRVVYFSFSNQTPNESHAS